MDYKLTSKMYKEALKEGKLLGLECKQCGEITAPPNKVCTGCDSEDLDIVELSGRGQIQTFTVIHVPPEGFEAPYVVAMAELDEGPWLMGNVEGVDPNKVTMDLIGRRVKIGHKVVPADEFSAGERVALTFSLI